VAGLLRNIHLHELAKEIGITRALGHTQEGKRALWQVIARVIDQGSRLSAVRLAGSHGACAILGITQSFNEEHLYKNLDWLSKQQEKIEDRLFNCLHSDKKPELYLYDVTSSYLEGQCNELGAFGYNRDGKRGKRQIVVGLLCDGEGRPLSIEVFCGNTQDPKTVASQIRKVAERFGGQDVTFVGDRGMLKNKQVEDVKEHGFHYITGITKPQIESLLVKGVLQMDLFDEETAEVESDEIRYILRRNPIRAEQMQEARADKLRSLEKFIGKKNDYLSLHKRAKKHIALRDSKAYCEKLRIAKLVSIEIDGDIIRMSVNAITVQEEAKLDGCYVLKTDIPKQKLTKEIVHARYKDLAQVEWAFRTSKTMHLELRPVHVRKSQRTRGHAFVVMLAYRIVQELQQRWKEIDVTVEEGIKELTTLCATDMTLDEKKTCSLIPTPRASVKKLLQLAGVTLPGSIPCSKVNVATRRKLVSRRVTS